MNQSFSINAWGDGDVASPTSLYNAFEQLSCLIKQEQRYYVCQDYLSTGDEEFDIDSTSISSINVVEQIAKLVTDPSIQISSLKAVNNNVPSSPSSVCMTDLVNKETPKAPSSIHSTLSYSRDEVVSWREQMLDWSYAVVDSFSIDRELVSIAFNILDRFVAKESTTTNVPITREDFQLFCMTSLYIAVKTSETYPRKLSMQCLVNMSGGYYAEEDITETEQEILSGLNWFINPPTGSTFCDLYWSILSVPATMKMESTCQAVIELAMYDAFFLSKPSWWIGLAAVLVACDLEGLPKSIIDSFVMNLSKIIDIHRNGQFDECFERLKYLYTTV